MKAEHHVVHVVAGKHCREGPEVTSRLKSPPTTTWSPAASHVLSSFLGVQGRQFWGGSCHCVH